MIGITNISVFILLGMITIFVFSIYKHIRTKNKVWLYIAGVTIILFVFSPLKFKQDYQQQTKIINSFESKRSDNIEYTKSVDQRFGNKEIEKKDAQNSFNERANQ